ncbi:putative Enhancer of polycomb-like protein 1 [Hypsibius exemplaris]|uniref:Enhancer of polycomb-like protein n=1 Tax=Hypsibius exemplaris TaxID=2072580 RepID=A0A1W0WRX0_HYPEX|nr:putative Enhancer of polycomb-like protein 1 [Hypsibius exemplaris]
MAQKNMRTRNLDHTKPLVIFDATRDDVPDKMDQQAFIRTTNVLPATGIDKEEETEHHLQLALIAVQSGYSAKEIAGGIPVPKVEPIKDSVYDSRYPTGYRKEKELYRVQGLSSGPEPDVVDYCIDEVDDAWLREMGARLGITIDRFESAIDRLEKATGAQYISEFDAGKLLKDKPEVVAAIHAHWLSKRKRLSHALISRVRTETKRDSGSGHDPYVAFRRRAEKMQTRKNRKSDEQNYVLMFKLRIAHTQVVRDGLMDILRGIRERETLKLRTCLVERHEFQLSQTIFDDPAGFYQAQVLDNYPELNRIEADTFDDVEYDEEAERDASEVKEEPDSLEEFSEVSDSGNESDSWSRAHGPELKNRSPLFDERDDNASNFTAPIPLDPNLVPEAQYRGDAPPEYWGDDGEFTFVPRKDCKYLQIKDEECDIDELDQLDDPLRGFFLQEIPVILGAVTVMKMVLARRTYGLNGTKHLEYYKLPDEVANLDFSELYGDDSSLAEGLTDFQHMIREQKEPIYLHSDAAIREEFPLPEEPIRWNLTEEDVEELYQDAMRLPFDCAEPTNFNSGSLHQQLEDEETDQYQIVCTSTCQPLYEHDYCKVPAYGDLDRFFNTDADMEEVLLSGNQPETSPMTDSASEVDQAQPGASPAGPLSSVEGSAGDSAAGGTLTPPTSQDASQLLNGKKKVATAKKPKATKQTELVMAVNGTLGIKRMQPEPSVPGAAPANAKKPVRKRVKPNAPPAVIESLPAQSENANVAAVVFQVPAVPGATAVPVTSAPIPFNPVAVAVAPTKKQPVKRKTASVTTATTTTMTSAAVVKVANGGLETLKNGAQNGDDAYPNKKPKRTPKKKEQPAFYHSIGKPPTPIAFAVNGSLPGAFAPKSPPALLQQQQRSLLPSAQPVTALPMTTNPGIAITVPSVSGTLTYSAAMRTTSLPNGVNGGLMARTTSLPGNNPHLQQLLQGTGPVASSNGSLLTAVTTPTTTTNGYHSSVVVGMNQQNQNSISLTVGTPKLC